MEDPGEEDRRRGEEGGDQSDEHEEARAAREEEADVGAHVGHAGEEGNGSVGPRHREALRPMSTTAAVAVSEAAREARRGQSPEPGEVRESR